MNTIPHRNILFDKGRTKETFEFKCRGCSMYNRDMKWLGYVSSNSYGNENNSYLIFEEEPSNRFDPNAIIVSIRGEMYGTVGYVGREYTGKVKELLKKCRTYRIDMKDIHDCGKKTLDLVMSLE